MLNLWDGWGQNGNITITELSYTITASESDIISGIG